MAVEAVVELAEGAGEGGGDALAAGGHVEQFDDGVGAPGFGVVGEEQAHLLFEPVGIADAGLEGGLAVVGIFEAQGAPDAGGDGVLPECAEATSCIEEEDWGIGRHANGMPGRRGGGAEGAGGMIDLSWVA